MKIAHIAIWTYQLEALKAFYATYFGGTAGEKYFNPTKKFTSYFLRFETGAELELMSMPGISRQTTDFQQQHTGLIHLAFEAGSRQQVLALTERLRADGFEIVGEPRTTGDGFFESIVLDPDGNLVEIACKA